VKILMVTNTYGPIVGGLERSVEVFSRELEKRGHQVMVLTPQFKGVPQFEKGVLRVPAIRHVNKTDYSLPMPLSGRIAEALKHFAPDLIHSHHPFFLGGTALRLAGEMVVPLILTYHTMLENYTYVVPGDSTALKQFVVEYAVRYANLCDHVVVPSRSIAAILRDRGVGTPMTAIPTGIYVDRFSGGDGKAARRRFHIPESAFVVGYCGRVTQEKNLEFLSRVVADFLRRRTDAFFLVVGEGSLLAKIRRLFAAEGLASRFRAPGLQTGRALADGYRAMNVMAFASRSETQGLVLAEAMAAGVPVVGIDAPGVREIVKDEENGRLVREESREELISALEWVYELGEGAARLSEGARSTASAFSVAEGVEKTIALYRRVVSAGRLAREDAERSFWKEMGRNLESEWKLFQAFAAAATESLAKVAAERSYFQEKESAS
jgi:1,2-diacylglycerol 3-alpha-glucosyltransferase